MSAEPTVRVDPVRRPRILVVDDVPMFLELESLFLSRHGTVVCARSGEEALLQMEEQPADVAVVDLHLPDIAGDALCGDLRRVAGDPRLPVVLVSNGRPEEHARAVRAGATDVISKPLSRNELVGAVARMLVPGGPRGLPRVPLDIPVEIRAPEQSIEGRLCNLSRGGAFVAADWFPPEGTEVALSFELGDTRTRLETTGTTVWRQLRTDRGTPGIGVRFLDLDGSAMRQLDGWVHERYQPRADEGWQGDTA